MAIFFVSLALLVLGPIACFSASPGGNYAAVQIIQKSSGLPAIGYLILDSGKVKNIQAAGLRRTNGTAEVTVGDKWHIGSCAKAMTAAVLARLVERGVISWNTTLSAVFSKVHPELAGATVRQLLTHTAGLPRDFPLSTLQTRETNLYLVQKRRTRLVTAALRNAPLTAPGASYQYSNLGYTVAGHVAEKVTGRPWHVLLREELFGPLGINAWGLGSAGIGNLDAQPWGHTYSNEKWIPIKPGPFADNPLFMAPAGTLHMPLRDWARFIRAHLLGGESGLLQQATFDELRRPDLNNYAPGWTVDRSFQSVKNTTVWWHAGSNTVNLAVAAIFPEWDQAVLLVTNGVDRPQGAKVQAGLKKVFEDVILPQLGPSDT